MNENYLNFVKEVGGDNGMVFQKPGFHHTACNNALWSLSDVSLHVFVHVWVNTY